MDPNQIYTLEGLAAKGWTIEDVEAELGYPRGYTDFAKSRSLAERVVSYPLRQTQACCSLGTTRNCYRPEA
jgi:hypothetical protein